MCSSAGAACPAGTSGSRPASWYSPKGRSPSVIDHSNIGRVSSLATFCTSAMARGSSIVWIEING